MQNKQLTYLLRLIVIGLILLLNACSTVTKDGPPSYNVDVSQIPDAVPKPEKLSKLGNYSTYRVLGKSYHVMKSSKNYEQIGIASWYGTKFHAQRTSSGERYDMLAMTAAHKSLPLPTYVLVTNLANDKKVIVKVNDRGPFESNRLIDLSYVAAKKLGMLGHGTAMVDVKAIDPLHYDKNIINHRTPSTFSSNFELAENGDVKNAANESNNTVSQPNLSKKYKTVTRLSKIHQHNKKSLVYLQVGVFKNKVYAERLKRRVHQLVASPISIASSKHLYKVQIGPLRDYATAKHITKRLKAVGLHSKEFTEV